MWKLIMTIIFTLSFSAFAGSKGTYVGDNCDIYKKSWREKKSSCRGLKKQEKKDCKKEARDKKKNYKACKKRTNKKKGGGDKHAKKCDKFAKKLDPEVLQSLGLSCENDPKNSAKLMKKVYKCKRKLDRAQKKGGAKDLTLKDVFVNNKCDKKKLKGGKSGKGAAKCLKYLKNIAGFYKEAYQITDNSYCNDADKTKVKNLKAIAKCSKKNGKGPYTSATGAKFEIQEKNGRLKCKKAKGAN